MLDNCEMRGSLPEDASRPVGLITESNFLSQPGDRGLWFDIFYHGAYTSDPKEEISPLLSSHHIHLLVGSPCHHCCHRRSVLTTTAFSLSPPLSSHRSSLIDVSSALINARDLLQLLTP